MKSNADRAPLSVTALFLSPKFLAAATCAYVYMLLLIAVLTLAVYVNKVTICNFRFGCTAVRLLHRKRALFNLRGFRR